VIVIYTIFKISGSENFGEESSLSKENFVLLPDLSLPPTKSEDYDILEVDDFGLKVRIFVD